VQGYKKALDAGLIQVFKYTIGEVQGCGGRRHGAGIFSKNGLVFFTEFRLTEAGVLNVMGNGRLANFQK
jgi:hypothetical protein